MNATHFDRVRQFVSNIWSQQPGKIRSETRPEEDHGMTGSDTAEILKAFAKEFDVDLSGWDSISTWIPIASGRISSGPLMEIATAKR